MDLKKLESAVMSVLFACGEPISADRLSDALETDKATLIKVIRILKDRLEEENLGIVILKLGEEYQLSSDPDNAEYVKTALDRRKNVPLSQAAMEVLAVIAYNQPVTKGFVEQVRGVNSDAVVAGLCEKNLIEEAGRLDLPGHPISYKTTANFLRCFGLESLSDLPSTEHLEKKREEEENSRTEDILLGGGDDEMI